jgi:hypothetical protein
MEFAQLNRLPIEMKLLIINRNTTLDHDQLDYEPLLTHIETEGETKKYELIQNACQRFGSMKIFFVMHSHRHYWREFIAVRLIDGRAQ